MRGTGTVITAVLVFYRGHASVSRGNLRSKSAGTLHGRTNYGGGCY